jgi:hypothetical protein
MATIAAKAMASAADNGSSGRSKMGRRKKNRCREEQRLE